MSYLNKKGFCIKCNVMRIIHKIFYEHLRNGNTVPTVEICQACGNQVKSYKVDPIEQSEDQSGFFTGFKK